VHGLLGHFVGAQQDGRRDGEGERLGSLEVEHKLERAGLLQLRYDFLTRRWPEPLWFLRPAIIWAFRSIPSLGRRMRIADQGLKLVPKELLTGSGQSDLHP
jgi:hypothetical protein